MLQKCQEFFRYAQAINTNGSLNLEQGQQSPVLIPCKTPCYAHTWCRRRINTHAQETPHTMKDKREAFLFFHFTWCTFIVQWCDSWFHILRSLGLHCDFSHSTPTHVGLGVPTVSKDLSELVRSHKYLDKDVAPHYHKAIKFYDSLAKQPFN